MKTILMALFSVAGLLVSVAAFADEAPPASSQPAPVVSPAVPSPAPEVKKEEGKKIRKRPHVRKQADVQKDVKQQ